MSKRTERRAAERLARKEAFKARTTTPVPAASVQSEPAEPTEAPSTTLDTMLAKAQAFFGNLTSECPTETSASLPPQPEQDTQISEAQLAANRANAQLSSGPLTPEGKAKSSSNSLKHALTGNTVLLPTDDLDEYNRLLKVQLDVFQPATEEEQNLIQSIVDSGWRISRIKRLETGIYLKGHSEFANKFNDQPEFRRSQMIETETYLRYEKSFRNLQIQESRLYRRIEKERAELTRLQSNRKREERLAAEQSKRPAARPAPQPVLENGFVFSTPQTAQPATVVSPRNDKAKAA